MGDRYFGSTAAAGLRRSPIALMPPHSVYIRGTVSVRLAGKCPYPGTASSCETSGMDHDAAWKRLFGLPALIEHLLVGFAGPAARRLDFGTLRQLPADSVDAGGEASLPLAGAYLLLDANRRAGEDLPRDNLVGAVFGLNAAATPGGMADRLRAVPRGLGGGALRALIDWIRAVFPEKFPQSDAAEVIASLEARFPDISKEEGTMMALAKRAQEWEEEYGRQGFEKGLRQGLERGEKRGLERGLAAERELLRRQAARKFGAAAGDALVRHLAGVSDPDRLAAVGERIIDCGTGAELIERLGADRDGAGAH